MTEREAKIKAMAEKIRAEARAKSTVKSGGAPAAEDGHRTAGAKRGAAAQADPRNEEEDAKKLEEMLPLLEQKVTTAEDEADKVTILAAPLAMEASEELKSLQSSAIKDTERAVKAAMTAVVNAKKELDKRVKEAESFAPFAASATKEEIARLTPRLDAAQAKVDEHKNVRRDYEQSIAAERLFDELQQRLASVEIDCEKAAMMAEPLAKVLTADPEAINVVEIRETKEALRVAQAMLAPTMRLISGKVQGLKGTIRTRMVDLQARAESSQAVLDRAQQTVEEAQSRAAAVPILKQSAERIEKVEEALQEMREAEAPFLMGIETMPADESGEVLDRMDKAASSAQSTLADAHKFVSMKLVEVGRLAESAGTSAKRELDRAKQQLDESMTRVRSFQAEAAKRRRLNLVVIVKEKIEEAELTVSKLKEATVELELLDEGHLQEALERALVAEVEAQTAVTAARREAQEKQVELRPTEGMGKDELQGSSEIVRTKLRVSNMEGELSKFRKLAASLQEKIKVGKSLAQTQELLAEAEAEVERLSEVVASWPKDQKPPAEADKGFASVQTKLTSATTQVEQRLQSAQGLELKELRGIFSRLQKAQFKLDGLKDQKKQRTKAASNQMVMQASEAVRKAEAAIATVSSAAAAGDLPATRLEELNRQASEAMGMVGEATQLLSKQTAGPQLALEAKVEFARLQLRCKAIERKGRATAERVSQKFDTMASEVERTALTALRKAARRDDDSYDTDVLFVQLSGGGTTEITEQQFVAFLGKNEPYMTTDRAKLALARIAPHGLSRRNFAAALTDYQRVVRDITLTDDFEINSAKKVRKLVVGEIIEATGAARANKSLGLERTRCRAVRDGATGWVTVRSSGGTTYLSRASKPFLWCSTFTDLRETREAESPVLRKIAPGEVVELVRGPMEERISSDTRVRGVACHEEAVGWLQVSDKTGAKLAAIRSNVFKCSEAIAMTDVADFESCTMVRRIEAGEALVMIKDEEEVQLEGGTRRKFRACRDGREGWITMQGSQGTVYLRPAPKHYICLQATPMHTGLGAESAVVRVLMPGEAFNAFEEPRDVSGSEDQTSYLVRLPKESVEGWVTSTMKKEVQEWSTRYKCLKTVPLTGALAASEAADTQEVTRLLEPGELVDVAEPPCEDVTTNFLRAKCVAVKDKVSGWVTVRESGTGPSSLLLRPATPEEVAEVDAAAVAEAGADAGAPAPSTPPAARGMKRPAPAPWAVKEELAESGGYKGKVKGGGKGKFKRM